MIVLTDVFLGKRVGEIQSERSELTQLAFNRYTTSMKRHDRADDGKPQSRASLLAGTTWMNPVETIKQSR
ncbi:hypothetical protein AFK24_06310 [Pseudomonas syringae]|uniref:Uncharacterized protein n=1 Tax=Pseudomonas syringae TaxID=317 RepID=A0A1C7Z8J2_PSESX|nr:hypothetical protein AFK24_06310 [Pseudomonas syringae]